jgi:hypothetical protein
MMNLSSLKWCFTLMLAVTGSALYAQDETWLVKQPEISNVFGNMFRSSSADINNDRYPDIISVGLSPTEDLYKNRKPIRIHLNVDDPNSTDPSARQFIDITTSSKVNIVPPDSGQNACVFTLADFNNDGNVDLITGIYYHRIEGYTLNDDRPQVYLGDGMGGFTVVPVNGLNDLPLFNIRQFSALDYDRDGILDLFVATWFYDYTNEDIDHAYIFRGNGDGTFTNTTTSTNIYTKMEPNYGSAATDWNNDCWPDIFTSPYCRTGGSLWMNNGDNTFTQVGDTSGSSGYNLKLAGDNGQAACTFSTVPEDVDNDGDMDLFLCVVHGGNNKDEFRSTIAYNLGPDSAYRYRIVNNVLPTSSPASTHRGDYNAAFLDFDNDGYKDAVMTQGTYGPGTDRTYFWKQLENGSFTDITRALKFITGPIGNNGIIDPDIMSTGGIEVIDYDLDGDDDLVQNAASGKTLLFRNDAGTRNNWVAVELRSESKSVNKSCVGARITVYAGGRKNVREIMVGRGQHTGQQPLILNFGLGTAQQVDSITVRWPNSICETTTVYNKPVNSIVTIIHRNVGIEEQPPAGFMMKVFPNPTSHWLVLQSADAGYATAYNIYTMDGRKLEVPVFVSDGDKIIFDLANTAPGLYLARVTLPGGRVFTSKVIRAE